MISVIVPVYNVELYLRKCLDSIVNQTYRDIEILVIDDGSIDGCGRICDEYAEKDGRIRVFHTENRGLSCARNLGLDNAHGEWIGFVDSDDWIEMDMYENAINGIGDADILCFQKTEGTYSGLEALYMYINNEISVFTWNKLYRKELFDNISYPGGCIWEDIATTYLLLHKANKVRCRNVHGYHYAIRQGSISRTHNLKNIFDNYIAVKEQYNYCNNVIILNQDSLSIQQIEKLRMNLKETLAHSIVRGWGLKNECHPSESQMWEELSYVARTQFPYSVRRRLPWVIHGGLLLARFNHPISFWLANIALRTYQKNRR